MDSMICYCFDYRKSDIVKDLEKNEGRSEILQEIMAAKKRGECQCKTRHPEAR